MAEVMSQQTGIDRVGPKWRLFIDRWPSPQDLAGATTLDLVTAWTGLGYNRRALALREAARSIVRDHAGLVPTTIDGLRRLPGVGPYSARAVAAIAFSVPVAPLDVNVRRVMTRVLGGSAAPGDLQSAADRLVSRTDPGAWVHAVMDLAVSICTRKAPDCDRCPVAQVCRSRGTSGEDAATKLQPRFASTSRWLRGRLLASVAEGTRGTWIRLPDHMGEHDADAIRRAARALEREGFLEVREGLARMVHDE